MFRIISKYLNAGLTKSSSVLALVYFLLFNTAVIIYKFSYYKTDAFDTIIFLLLEALCVYCFLVIAFLGFSINRLLFVSASLFLFFTGAIASYYLFFFNTTFDVAVTELFKDGVTNAYKVISPKLLLWIIFSIFICIHAIKHFSINNTKTFSGKLLSAICLFITIYTVAFSPYNDWNIKYKTCFEDYFPMQYLHSIYQAFSKNRHPTNKE